MKTLATLILAVAAAAALPAHAETHIGVSIGINAPGHYGRIDINNYPQPAVVSVKPVIHVSTPIAVHRSPIYLYVPERHRGNWGRYCGRYGACSQPVLFVQEGWVRSQYRSEHDNRNGRKKPKHQKKDHGRGHGH